MIGYKRKIDKNNKIHNKNYHNKVKKHKGNKQFRKNSNADERAQLQKEIDEKLRFIVEENKRKQYDELRLNIENEQKKKKKNDSGAAESDNEVKRYKNNLTIIDKNVLTQQEFKNLPISKKTLRSLNENNFTHMTNIQSVSIPIVLLNKHIYAQAQTGTGKTLCFCVPLVEKLYRENIDSSNKILGGLIITPTRELVFQIFEVLNMLNKYHKLNICCAIGGKDEEREKAIFSYSNIIVCTPGRLLYHLENNYYCNLDYLSTLIIDEIDKLIDKSFYDNLKSILLYKPKDNCQICLFSATICKFLSIILKTFNIKDYEYVSINNNDKYIESNNIKQIYIECSIYDKINYLYTFLFSKKNRKIIVFFSTCKQVRFMFEVFKKIKVGVMKFLQLHGKLKQTSRLNTYHLFSKKNNFVCLFTTDIACRGLDFASVDWVIHFDFPENLETFIHRSGRTGRFTNVGNSLIFLTNETDNKKYFLNVLRENNIEIVEKFIKKQKLFDINKKIHSLNAAFVEIKHLAKKALIIYLRHLYIIMKFRGIKNLDLNQLAYAYGLIEFSQEMMDELNINDGNKIEMKKKRSRFEKFLEILKARKSKKGGKEENEDGTNENKKDSMNKLEYNNADNSDKSEDELRPSKTQKSRDTSKGNTNSDNDDITNIQEEDDLFVPQRVEIEDSGPLLLPTKKRRKRVKVAKMLSNSVLYDDVGNEINDENVKFKILVNELNENGEMEQSDIEGKDTETDDEHTKNKHDEKSYIELLKEKVEKDNEQIKIDKLRRKENMMNRDNSDNSDEQSDYDKESSSYQEDNYNSSENSSIMNDQVDDTQKMNKLIDKKSQSKKQKEDKLNENISDLEDKVMMFL
ncbi:ATP-dependent RNA helicase DBP4, putative [Plasmodium vinckei brucechwatti]|uniref:ATP-dependent RNA helicase n=1 Tax=Plasmodium vinckei brucechwatti TaxID=119398 RepID=A0A6V7S789_PLAVN|nr:ATP-dependent RNA helicase DBP4, putative [Plasmodium vinckei brucechwatti]